MRGRSAEVPLITARRSVGCVMKLLEHEAVGGQVAFLDRAVVIALQRLAKDVVGLVLQGIQRFGGIGFPDLHDRVEQLVAVKGIQPSLVPHEIMTQPRAAGTEQGQQQNPAPDIVAVFVQECPLGAVDIGGRSRMGRDRGVLVGIRLLDLGRARNFPGKRRPNREQVSRKGADHAVGQGFRRDDQVITPMVSTVSSGGRGSVKELPGISSHS